jgi:two-component system, NtrC family, sensor kinase
MPYRDRKGRLSFQAKVLVPVVTIMAVLVMATILLVNHRITDEFQVEAAQKLSVASGVFNNSQKIRTRNLLLRYRNVPNEPRAKAVLQKGDPQTVRVYLGELLNELGGEISFFTTAENHRLADSTRDPELSAADFAAASGTSVTEALEAQANVETILAGTRLFDIVSIPVTVGDNVIGAVSFGVAIGQSVAEEFKQLTHTEVVFRADDGVLASTLLKRNLQQQLASALKASGDTMCRVQLDGEHFLAAAGHFATREKEKSLGYVLLSSYEQSLSVLRATQRMLVLVSILGIGLSTGVIWVLIRKITQPLRELRDSAEAVGKGDFSRRVLVASRDECGELAGVFNHMTENLKSSREELEKTVATLKTTQAQLIQSEKLSAIGEFVAGVAHELNNPLTSVVGFAELLQQSDVSERHRKFLGLIVISAQRCHKIVQSLLSFARQHKPERKPVELREVAEASVAILQYQLRTNNIQVVTQFEAGLPKVLADAHQLQQVFVNLINNARQAIEAHRPSGMIRITTERCGRGARICFQDDGPGIAKENLTKVFNPFFTTKDVGKGTGLGLSLSYGIIKEHGGSINVDSNPGQGATFTIELPLAPEGADVSTAGSGGVRETFDGRGKKVLVIDDEELILDFVCESLAAIRCEVDVAADGETALRYLRQTHYDLALCDWKMPGMSGQQLYERISQVDPAAAARFVFITGDIMNERVQSFLKETGKVCLPKPLSVEELRSAIGTALKAA